MAAHNEENKLVELKKRRKYLQPPKDVPRQRWEKPGDSKEQRPLPPPRQTRLRRSASVKRLGTLHERCRSRLKQGTTGASAEISTAQSDILQLLYSSGDEGGTDFSTHCGGAGGGRECSPSSCGVP